MHRRLGPGHVVEMIGQGVRDYIVKPIKASTVLAKVRAALAEEESVIEPWAQTIERLEIDLLEFTPLVNATVPALDKVADDLVAALRARNARAVRTAAEQVKEPAAIIGAHRASATADCVLLAGPDLETLHFTGVLVTEIGEPRSALRRVGIARRV